MQRTFRAKGTLPGTKYGVFRYRIFCPKKLKVNTTKFREFNGLLKSKSRKNKF
jgi:hypothetical protein